MPATKGDLPARFVGRSPWSAPEALARLLAIFLLAIPAPANRVDDGITAFTQGHYSEALKQLQPEAASGNERARVYFALTEAALGRCDAALPSLTSELQSRNSELARLAGLAATRCYSSSNKTPRALAIAEQLKQRFPDNADVLYLAAETEMKTFNDTTFQMFQRTPSSYRVHELSARIFEVQNRFSDAISEYQKAIEQNPNAPDLHFRLGRAILMQSHTPAALDSAAAAFQQELTISPEDSACEFQLGQIAQVKGQSAEARRHFERALQLSPDFVSAIIALGSSYSREQQYDRAIALLRRATALQPENESAHYALLTAYRNAGQLNNARAEQATLQRLQKPPAGEFSDFLKKLGDKQPQQ